MNRHASMNRIYRLVWSWVRSAWVPVAETTRACGKSGRSRSGARVKAATATAAAALLWGPLAQAGPTGGEIVSGQGTITKSGNTTAIHQSSETLSIDWLSFNVAANQTVDFLQPNSSAIAVNRIEGTTGSEILGHLDANGEVYLINPNGIVFGEGAQVNVGGLIASTLDLSDASLGSSTRSFTGSGTGSVINEGTITANPGGYVALLGNHVSNEGLITAQLGTVALGAGNALTLTLNGTSLVHLVVDRSVLGSLAANGGLIQADGGEVILTAGARDALLASVVNNTGIIEARTVEDHEGTITLLGGMGAGTVNIAGTLDASAPEGGNGGFIDTSAAHVQVANDARITTAASKGLTGSWLIDPHDFTIAPSGGDITGAALSSELGTTSVILESSQGAMAGTGSINVDDTVSWSANTLTLTAAYNINVNAVMTATGTASLALNPSTANGGAAAVSGGTVVMGLNSSSGFTGVVNFSGTGTLSINGTTYTVINSLGAQGSTTGTDLQGMQGNLSGHYALGSNIDADVTSTWNGGAGFTPVGSSTLTPFTGTFDGLGHVIYYLTIDQPSAADVGLFGVASAAATIRNVGSTGNVSGYEYVGALVGNNYGTVGSSYGACTRCVAGASGVSGTYYVGGLVGYNHGAVSASWGGGASGEYDVGGLVGVSYGTISNSYATRGGVSGSGAVGGLVGVNDGTVSNSYATGGVSGGSSSFYVGGLVGENDGTVSNSYATGGVSAGSGSEYIGGLVGYSFSGSIANSYATGTVSGVNWVGGLIGVNASTVSSSYATGNVSGTDYVGGLVAYNEGTVSNSYATGSVSGGSDVGGLVGYNSGTVTNSFWDTTSSGQSSSAGGTGMSTANMQTQVNFTSATAANGNVNPNWDFTNTWVMYNGYTYPLLRAFMTLLTVTANSGSVTYNGSAYDGALGVTYSVAPSGHLYGTLSYTSSPSPAINVGTYTVTPGGLYSDQQGYIISYGSGTISIDPLASVKWVGGVSGNWSTASNWAGGALPDLGNVLAVTIPAGDTVTYDSGMTSLGTTVLSSLTSKGTVVMAAGALDTTGTFRSLGYEQTGGMLTAGTLKIASTSASGVELGDVAAGALSVSSSGGAITELAGASLDVTGASTLTAQNGSTDYGITLANAGNSFGGAITATGSNIDLQSGTGNLVLENTTATGTLTVTAAGGAIKQAKGTLIDVAGLVTAQGSAITLDSSEALDADVTSTGATSLTAAGPLEVSGSIGTSLTTVTTGSASTTTFGDTTVGKKLVVTSPGYVSTLAGDTLTVDGKGTTKPNKHVTVNGVSDVAIPVQ